MQKEPRGEEKSVAESIRSTRGRYRRVFAVLVIAALLLAVPAEAYICFGKSCITGVTCCDGTGTCTGYNKCTCYTGYYGQECQNSSFCGMSGSTPICTYNCTPWGSSASTTSHGTCISNSFKGTFYESDSSKSYSYITYSDVNLKTASNICTCNQGWTGACCSNYQPGTLTPSVLDFGNVTVGAPAGSTADVLS